MASCGGCSADVEDGVERCEACESGLELSLTETIKAGDYTQSMKRLALELSWKLEEAEPGQSASIAKQLREVLDELVVLKQLTIPEKPKPEPVPEPPSEPSQEGTVHELARRRVDRRAGAAAEAPS